MEKQTENTGIRKQQLICIFAYFLLCPQWNKQDSCDLTPTLFAFAGSKPSKQQVLGMFE